MRGVPSTDIKGYIMRFIASSLLVASCVCSPFAGPASGLPGGDGPPRRTVAFAGQRWEIKQGRDLGPGPNQWSDGDECVRLDEEGSLHLGIARAEGRWSCAEVTAPDSLGYGAYRWVIAGDLTALDPRTVLGIFLYEDDAHEVDFELSRWGKARDRNAQFVVQPPTEESRHRFDTGRAKVITCRLDWKESSVRCRCWEGDDPSRAPLADWTYSGKNLPRPGATRVHLNLWLFQGKPPIGAARQEVVVRSFRFSPAAAAD
jgi:hypothetical protein